MNVVFEKMKDLIPFRTCIKMRENGDFLIVSNENLDITYLNETSKDFYQLCDGQKSILEICKEISNIYDVDFEDLKDDMITFIRDMQWNDIIELRKKSNEII